MKKNFLFTLATAIITTFLLSSCVSTKIQSNKSTEFNEKVHKIFITMRGSDASKAYMKSLMTSLKSELEISNVETSEYFFDPLSLETPKDIEGKVVAYNPDVVMTIDQTERRTTANQYGWGSSETGATLDIKLFKPNSEKPIWRASLKADGQFGVKTTYQSSAKKIVKSLQQMV